jgi:cell division protein FtsX
MTPPTLLERLSFRKWIVKCLLAIGPGAADAWTDEHSSPTAMLSASSRPVVEAARGLRRHPLPTLLVVAVVAVSLVLVGVAALASEQARLLDLWYRESMPGGSGVEDTMARQLLPLLAWGRNALWATVAAAAVAVALAVRVSMAVAAYTRRDDERTLRVLGASNAQMRLALLAQATAVGLAGALVAYLVLRLGTWLFMRAPQEQAALDGLRMVGQGELLAVLPLLVVVGVAACWAGGLLSRRALGRT